MLMLDCYHNAAVFALCGRSYAGQSLLRKLWHSGIIFD